MLTRVLEYSGYSYAREPRVFFLGDTPHEVVDITRSWVEESVGLEGMRRRIWEVLDEHGDRFVLTHYLTSDFWEISY